MSMSSYSGDNKYFKQITRDRLLYEMLGSAKNGGSQSSWQVLIMDKFTVKVMSNACKMADITNAGVSLVEDIYKKRQPLPTMDAIYFIQPSKENVVMLMSDMAGKKPLYKKAFVFFSSPIARELVVYIREDATVSPRIGGLCELNLEYFAFDRQGFVTDNERALEELFGDDVNYNKAEACLKVMAARVATAFASMRELPFVRYRAAKSLDANTMTAYRDLIPTKLAAKVWDNLTKYMTSAVDFPQTETCELLILDRSIDQIAPVIHEWTYDAMCRDLLNLEGNKYVHEVSCKTGGPPVKKEVLLDEHDPIWFELRHLHIADASIRLHKKVTNFVTKNKAASFNHSSREQGLKEIGELEENLVFGDAGTKEVIEILSTHEELSRENKLRLLMVYAAVHPEKFESDKGLKLMQLARLSSNDMNAVNNMKLLGTALEAKKRSIGALALKFNDKRKRGVRKERVGEETDWKLSRFYPMVEELIEKLSEGELSKDEYPCINDPSPTFRGTAHPAAIQYNETPAGHSMRSRRTPTWASRPRNSDNGYSSDSVLKHASSDFKKMGRRIFVFIVGGATRSELRACHKLSMKLNREIILGSSSIDEPPQFITKLKLLSEDELS